MSLQEIESAIRELSQKEQAQLINDLPTLMPELEGDVIWKLIALDQRPRPKLRALINELDAEYSRNPKSLPVMNDKDFDQ